MPSMYFEKETLTGSPSNWTMPIFRRYQTKAHVGLNNTLVSTHDDVMREI